MFITSEFSRINSPFFDDYEHGWTRVELKLHIPWYFCAIKEVNEQESITHIYLDNLKQLVEMLNNPQLTFLEVYLTSPSYMNKTGRWEMSRIVEILVSTNHKKFESNKVFKIIKENGSELVLDSIFEFDDSGLHFEMLVRFESNKGILHI